ncbi:MAG: hypothetical protein Kow0075_16280 [Salibacteraceae bacterium]
MKTFVSNLRAHVNSDFSWQRDGLVLLMLASLMLLNYGFDLEKSLLAKLSPPQYLLYFAIFYPTTYYSAVIIKCDKEVFSSRFIASSLPVLAALVVTSGLIYPNTFFSGLGYYEMFFLRSVILNLHGWVWLSIALLLISAYDKGEKFNYGIQFTGHNFKPYWYLLLASIPLVAVGIALPGFASVYPTFKTWNYSPVFGLSKPVMLFIYEAFYLLDFARVEWMFRGALVIGLVRYLGPKAIVPMAALYCVIHFNKPWPEAVSSYFGGYLLGTIAYYQKNIIGGIMIHAGIALLMDTAAYIYHLTMLHSF